LKLKFEPTRANDIALLAVGAAPATQLVLLGLASNPSALVVEEVLLEEELLEEEELEVVELDAELELDEELEDTELLLEAEELDELIEDCEVPDPDPEPAAALPPPQPANNKLATTRLRPTL